VFKLNNSILDACKPKQREKPVRKSSVNAFGVKNNHARGILSKSLNKKTSVNTEPSVIESSNFSKFK